MSPIKATRVVTVTFGLVNFECCVHTATDSESGPTLHLTHEHDDGSAHRVTTQYTCKAEGCEEVMSFGHCGRAVEVIDDDGEKHLITLTDDEVAGLDAKTRACEVIEFVDPEEVPAEMYGSLYYVMPRPPKRGDAQHVRAYTLFRESLRREGLAAIVSVSLREKTARGMLYVSDDLIMMRMLLWPAQVRRPEFPGWADGVFPQHPLSEPEIDLAGQLVRALTRKFDPDRYVDPRATAIQAIVDAKMPTPTDPKREETGAQVINLIDRVSAKARVAG